MKIPPTGNILVLSLMLLVLTLYGNSKKLYTIDQRIILQEGLSQSRIISILEDERGFMWFGTADGLNRWDGYNFKIFRNIINDNTSIPNNTINSMVEDVDGNIWIGTNNGIARFNPYTETFITIKETDATAIFRGANKITACAIDRQNNLWFGTEGFGLIKFNPQNHSKEYFFNENKSNFNSISNLFIDSRNRLWIGIFIETNISYLDLSNNNIVSIHINDLNNIESDINKVQTVYEDDENRIWISVTDYYSGEGSLFYLNPENDTFINYNEILSDEIKSNFSDSFNTITSITGDSHGNIWFSSILSGVFKFTFGKDPIAFYVESPITDSRINCIYVNRNDILWIGTNGNGIEISVPQKSDFSLLSSKTNPGIGVESIRCILEDDLYYWIGGYYGISKISKTTKKALTLDDASMYSIATNLTNNKLLWTGSEGGGVTLLNKETGEMTEIELNPADTNKQYIEQVYCLNQLSDTLLLIGSASGLFGYNPISKTTISFPYSYFTNTIGRYQVAVRSISFHNNDVLISYTQGGVGVLDLKNRSVLPYYLTSNIKLFKDYRPINCIYFDDQSNLWIATTSGLISINCKTLNTRHYTEEDGLPNSHIYSILPDEIGNIWMSTNNGLSCYDLKTGNFSNFDISDGLQNNEFNTGAYLKSRNGDLFFGGISGITYFNPEFIKQNAIIPKIAITGIKFANNYQQINKYDIDNSSIVIPDDEELFTIEFSGLSFINNFKNKYKYRISEISNEWIDLGNQHYISFNNLSPGNYTLEILASNDHGFWLQTPYTLNIKVLPTFFESVVFKWMLGIITILLIILGIRLKINSVTKQKDLLQQKVDEQTAALTIFNKDLQEEVLKHTKTTKELVSSNKTKDKFLSIIAHDIIGPLGVVQGFSDLLKEKNNSFTEDDKLSFYEAINLTTKRLTSLLSNLLNWSKLQSGSLSPDFTTFELNNVVLEVLLLLRSNINEKEIILINNLNTDIEVFADKNMVLTIIRNLVSNAIKFTPRKGSVTINSKTVVEMEQITICDTGIGIPESNINKLFTPESNFTTKGTNNEPGTGLGLGLVKEFVHMNRGEIWLESKVNDGTKFYFTLQKPNIK